MVTGPFFIYLLLLQCCVCLLIEGRQEGGEGMEREPLPRKLEREVERAARVKKAIQLTSLFR